PCERPSAQLHVCGEAVQATFPTHAAFLVAAKGRGRIELVESVGPDDTGADVARHLEDLRALVGPHTARKSIGRVVRFLHRFLEGAEGLDREDRPEDRLLYDAIC